MKSSEELDLILRLIKKYNLPLSPILEYAVNERKEEFVEKELDSLFSEHNNEMVIECSHEKYDESIMKPINDKVETLAIPNQQNESTFKGRIVSSPTKTYKDIAFGGSEKKRIEAVLTALEHFSVPVTPRDIARTVSRSAWGGMVKEDTVVNILNRLPEVKCLKKGFYILNNNYNE